MKFLKSKIILVLLNLVLSALAIADTYATFESGKDGIVLMTNQCPADKTGRLKWAISKFGSKMKEGCYFINEYQNPVVKWQDGTIQELDGKLFRIDPSQAIVKKEMSIEQSSPLIPDAKAVRPSFDCTKAHSDAERLICGDDQLSTLDNELSRIYKEAESKISDSTSFKKQTKAEWRWREDNCHTKECLLVWYVKRKGQLTKITEPSKQNDSSASESEWNHDENFADAARQYKGIYCATGMKGLEDYVRGCYASLNLKFGTVPQKLERCVGIDYTASRIDAAVSQEAKVKPMPFFLKANMFARTREAFIRTGMPNENLDNIIGTVGAKTISAVDSIGWVCNEAK